MKTALRFALPSAGGTLAAHFGHCEKFALVDVDRASGEVVAETEVDAPEHQPGLLPPWLKERGVDVVIAGRMGTRAQSLFQAAGVEVFTGAPAEAPSVLVRRYLAGTLAPGGEACEHRCDH